MTKEEAMLPLIGGDVCNLCNRRRPRANQVFFIGDLCRRKQWPAEGWETPEQEAYEYQQIHNCMDAEIKWLRSRVSQLEAIK